MLNLRKGLLLCAGAMGFCPTVSYSQVACDMSPAFALPDNDGSSSVGVWRKGGSGPVVYSAGLNVNTDGTRRSYSVSDFWGEKTAVNNLCNAMSDKCAGLANPSGLQARRELTQTARAQGWPPSLLKGTKISPRIIAMKGGKPCPEIDGFLVSATALSNSAVADVCSFDRYVDAMTVPAIVIPGQRTTADGKTKLVSLQMQGANLGDLAAVLGPEGRLVFAVVGDIGPKKEIGEGSIALAMKLLGKTSEPVNYRQIRGKKGFEGQGLAIKRVVTIIFPGTRDSAQPYMTRARIDQDGKAALTAWGGIERLKACATEVSQ